MKTCKYCGQAKDDTLFRKYYQGVSTGKLYAHCLDCGKIESRRQYLIGKLKAVDGLLIPVWEQELGDINALYDMRVAAGLEVPRSYLQEASIPVLDLVKAEMALHNKA